MKIRIIFVLLLFVNNMFSQEHFTNYFKKIPELTEDEFELSSITFEPDSNEIRILYSEYFTVYQDEYFIDWENINFNKTPISKKSLSSKNDYFIGKISGCNGENILFIRQIEIGVRYSYSRVIANIYDKENNLANQVIIAEFSSLCAPMGPCTIKNLNAFFYNDRVKFKWKIENGYNRNYKYAFYESVYDICNLNSLNRKKIQGEIVKSFDNPTYEILKKFEKEFWTKTNKY